MSRPFKSSIFSANKSFKTFKEPQTAGDYIYNKKAIATYCVANKCVPAVHVGSESNRLLFNRSNTLHYYPCKNTIDKTQLYINLISKLDLSGNAVIEDFSGNTVPAPIDLDTIVYLRYNIDPSGTLFGNTVCGINNFINHMDYTNPPSTTTPGHINNL